MATPDTLRYASIPLVHGSGAIPAVGFGTLIRDPVAAKQGTKAALGSGLNQVHQMMTAASMTAAAKLAASLS
jgi:hypothetical protein